MQVHTKAIVLSALKYGDTSLIVKLLTVSDGLKSYLLRGVLASKKGKLKTAYFQPLTQLEITANHKNKGTLERLSEVKVCYQYQSLHTSISKNAIALFLAEMLGNCILEEEANEDLFLFLEAGLQWLDTHTDVANFHLFFLMELTKFLGFYPDDSIVHLPYFDLQEGCFTEALTTNPMIVEQNLYYFKMFLGTNFDAMHNIRMRKKNRQELLNSIVLYFELHLHGFRKPKSLAILNEVFS